MLYGCANAMGDPGFVPPFMFNIFYLFKGDVFVYNWVDGFLKSVKSSV